MNLAPRHMGRGLQVSFCRSEQAAPGNLFHIRVEKLDGSVIEFTDSFVDAFAAQDGAADLANDPCARIEVTPLGERSSQEGSAS